MHGTSDPCVRLLSVFLAGLNFLAVTMISFLFIDTERVWRGGQDQLLSLLTGLIRRGHLVDLVCHPNTLLEKRARGAQVQVHPVSVGSEMDPIAFVRLWSVIRQIRPKILAFNTPKSILIGNLASRLTSVGARIIFRRVNFPLRRRYLARIKYTWGIDCIIAISESIRHQLEAAGIPQSRIRTIYEGMDLTPYPKRTSSAVRIAGKPAIVGTVAHLSPEKGLQYLIEAAALIPDVANRIRFVIVGDGKCRLPLEQQVRKRNLDECFEFIGFQDQPIEYLVTFDIFVLPSLSEGLSSAILTAMATSLPVVATRVGGIPELVRHEDNGLLVPPADPTALARAIERLVDSPEESHLMGQRGRLRLEEQFTLERKISETEELCSQLLRERASAPSRRSE